MQYQSKEDAASGLAVMRGLSGEDLSQIKELESICNSYEDLTMKLYWRKLMRRQSDEANDLLYFDGSRLVGYLGIHSFNSEEVEICGMTHPEYRSKGIFRRLVRVAAAECRRRDVPRMLFVCEKTSATGMRFMNDVKGKYAFSDYRMEYPVAESRRLTRRYNGVELRRALPEDARSYMDIDHLFVGASETAESDFYNNVNSDGSCIYIAESEGRVIGKVDVMVDGHGALIYKFGVKAEYRNRGYGREILTTLLMMLGERRWERIALEVSHDNANAIHLYRSIGFRVSTEYDYYEVLNPFESVM